MEVSNISMVIFHLYCFCLPNYLPIPFGAIAPSLSVNTFWGFFLSNCFWFYFFLLSFLQALTLQLCMVKFFQRKSKTTQPSSQVCLLTSNALHEKKKNTQQPPPPPKKPQTKTHKTKPIPNKKIQHTKPHKITVNLVFYQVL